MESTPKTPVFAIALPLPMTPKTPFLEPGFMSFPCVELVYSEMV